MMKEAGFSGISITYEKGPGMLKMMFARGIKQKLVLLPSSQSLV